ncbi:uncharacterized protein LOC126319968 isoform X1 [Schistocerca gregaria]|uniref:uncharacterized protein LOC126319968 isoform X1 n=1 Tax=Schistocerca gregaria TaxID=7010 RepID=UPI00211ECF2A|nr:uncharacterized protein LOC126319968 isoform X1 [Schistocerca gregaria]
MCSKPDEVASSMSLESEGVASSDVLMVADLELLVTKVFLTAETKEVRHLHRVLRKTFGEYRRKWTAQMLRSLVKKFFPDAHQHKEALLAYFGGETGDGVTPMEVDDEPTEDQTPSKEFPLEVEIYLSLLVLVWLIDSGRYDEGCELSNTLVSRLEGQHMGTLDPLSVKVYFYYSRSHELSGKLAMIRKKLFSLHQTAILHHNVMSQTTLLNLLLRNYLEFNLYDQAHKLISKTEFKESSAPSNELARYYYYQGRIKCLDPLQYRIAFEYLQQALRKAPATFAHGFRVAVIKITCIVQLLMGEIPERSLFLQKDLIGRLRPYLQLTAAVRYGDLGAFNRYIAHHDAVFTRDKTINLIQRMRNNVIKTGLHKISLSYSRIHFKDICEKLKLDSIEDAEFIVSKAIKDGTFDATIDHAGGFVANKEAVDVYSTTEPQEQFNARIQLFLNIHNDAVKAMRYMPSSNKNLKLEEGDLKLKNEEEELTAALAEDDQFF